MKPAVKKANTAPGLLNFRMFSKLSSSEEAFRRKIMEAEKEQDKKAPMWVKRDQSLRKRYGNWNPTRKLSRQQVQDIRDLKQQMPLIKTIQIADIFQINPESIRRILKSKWTPTEEELKEIEERAVRRKAKRQEKAAAEAQLPDEPTVVKVKGLIAQRQREQRKLIERKQKHTEKRRERRKLYTTSVGDLID